MASKQSPSQKATVERVMHEFKEGELETQGRTVKNPKQAIAIALSEAGSSSRQSPQENKTRQARTKAKERAGKTAEAEKEGKRAQDRTLEKGARGGRPAASSNASTKSSRSKAELYAEARKRDIPGRSRMNRTQLERALAH
ncbi:DUF6496 domain-containing protein [Nostoc sp. NIES-2111]